jgi:hypothetical protein
MKPMSRPHRTSEFGPQKRSVPQPLNYMLYGHFHNPGERIHSSSRDNLNFKTTRREFVPCTFRNILRPQKQRGTITLVTLMEYNSPNLTPCVGTPCISSGLSAERYLLFWAFAWPFNYSYICTIIEKLTEYNITHCLTEPADKPYPRSMVCLLEIVNICKFV